MTDVLLTPLDFGATTKVAGRLFRKQILPLGTINYKGRKVEFSAVRLDAIEAAFRANAFDTVPLVLADSDNKHTMDPRAMTGTVVDMERTPDGLDVIVRASPEAADLLEKYPEVGISARIMENYDRADGQHFEAAVQHALVTTDPRITGMRPWEAVNLSNDGIDNSMDLSGFHFEADARTGRTGSEVIQMAGNTDAPQLSAEELAQFRNLLAMIQSDDDAGEADVAEDESGKHEKEEEDVAPVEPELLTDAELEAIAEEALAEQSLVAASNENQSAVELANAQIGEQALQLSRLQAELDKTNYESERKRLAEESGIPPFITDLARPLLEGSHVLELSNGAEVDAGAIMREVFAKLGDTMSLLDLSRPTGHALATDADKADLADREEFTKRARVELGL